MDAILFTIQLRSYPIFIQNFLIDLIFLIILWSSPPSKIIQKHISINEFWGLIFNPLQCLLNCFTRNPGILILMFQSWVLILDIIPKIWFLEIVNNPHCLNELFFYFRRFLEYWFHLSHISFTHFCKKIISNLISLPLQSFDFLNRAFWKLCVVLKIS